MNELKTFTFGKGSHASREKGMCVMEAVAYLAGEDHSDSPKCASPVITKLAIWLNDTAADKLRQELLLDLPWRIVGTKADAEIEQKRAYMAADWAVRFVCPILFRRAGMEDEAKKLEQLDEVIDKDSSGGAAVAVAVAASAASAAAARAAWAAESAAAWAAESAESAARAAREAKVEDLDRIMRSCADLIDRMIRLTEPQEQMKARQRELLGV